jgi:predicted O-methyltransferase YrrM
MSTDLDTFAHQFAERLTGHINALNAIVKATGETLEGNCMYIHQSDFQTTPDFLNKQLNLVDLAKRTQGNLMEIGFNAGHSALLFLMTAPKDTTFLFFDIAEHSYVRPCFDYLRSEFPERQMELVIGDSKQSIPTWIQAHPDIKFDLIHLDGGHDYDCVRADVHSAFMCSKKGTILLMDDMDNEYVQGFVETMLKDSRVEPVPLLETKVYPHMAFRVLEDI